MSTTPSQKSSIMSLFMSLGVLLLLGFMVWYASVSMTGLFQQEEYSIQIHRKNLEVVEGRIRQTNIAPNEHIVQKGFEQYIQEKDFCSLERLKEITGIEPTVTVIQAGYKMYAEEGAYNDILLLQEITGVEPLDFLAENP